MMIIFKKSKQNHTTEFVDANFIICTCELMFFFPNKEESITRKRKNLNNKNRTRNNFINIIFNLLMSNISTVHSINIKAYKQNPQSEELKLLSSKQYKSKELVSLVIALSAQIDSPTRHGHRYYS